MTNMRDRSFFYGSVATWVLMLPLLLGLIGLAGITGCSSAPALGPGPSDPDAEVEFTKTPSGLQYRILRKGSEKKPQETDRVSVHYRGWLRSGREFDSSYKRKSPATFGLSEVVAGWTEGLQLIGEGGMIELTIPSNLGYGARSQGSIPPNATLFFIVELLKVE